MTEARGPEPVIQAFFDEPTNTVSYIVADPETKQPPSSIRARLRPQRRQRRHPLRRGDADGRRGGGPTRWSGRWRPTPTPTNSRLALREGQTGAKIGIGEHIKEVQKIFRPSSTPPT